MRCTGRIEGMYSSSEEAVGSWDPMAVMKPELSDRRSRGICASELSGVPRDSGRSNDQRWPSELDGSWEPGAAPRPACVYSGARAPGAERPDAVAPWARSVLWSNCCQSSKSPSLVPLTGRELASVNSSEPCEKRCIVQSRRRGRAEPERCSTKVAEEQNAPVKPVATLAPATRGCANGGYYRTSSCSTFLCAPGQLRHWAVLLPNCIETRAPIGYGAWRKPGITCTFESLHQAQATRWPCGVRHSAT